MNITIPVKKYLLKYLTNKYGPQLTLSKTTSLGIHILELLEKDFDPRDIPKLKCEECYTIHLGEFYRNSKGVTIHPSNLNNISNYLDRVFQEHLFEHVKIYKSLYNQELPGIRQFLEFYDISENDVKYDSIYRTYKRYKAKGQILIKC